MELEKRRLPEENTKEGLVKYWDIQRQNLSAEGIDELIEEEAEKFLGESCEDVSG